MPANLPPQYFEAERRYREAKTDEERIKILKEMFAIMPKHKGTDRLQGDLKRRISQLKKATEQRKKAKRGLIYNIETEGAGQVVLIGHPNAGKSQIISKVTNANPEVAPYPFTTKKPQAAMMPYDHIQIQLIDSPPITKEYMDSWMVGIIRNADGVLLIVDLTAEDPAEQVEGVLKKLEQSKLRLSREEKEIDYEEGIAYKKTLIVANKNESGETENDFSLLKELYGDDFPVISISTLNNQDLDKLKDEIYNLLGIIRIYTKEPGEKADFSDPIILKIGKTVMDAALLIHKDFAHNLKYARVWGKTRFEGQMVHRDFVLHDQDVVEFHI